MSQSITIAPMLNLTNRHYHNFMRQITQHTVLFTEMIVADAIIKGNRDKLLKFNIAHEPLVIQLGGSNPQKLSDAVKICLDYGYTKFNLNCGCPSHRVLSGNFGASLMNDVALVISCVEKIRQATNISISIKHRTGLEYNYDYKFLKQFVVPLAKVGVKHFIIHARNAVMNGLSPEQNREIPPLRYDYVYLLKKEYPYLKISLNGGIKTLEDASEHLKYVDSVMIGREAYYNPYLFIDVDRIFYGDVLPKLSRYQIALTMINYLEELIRNKERMHLVLRHMLGLYYKTPKARLWRQTLSTKVCQNNDLDEYIKLVNTLNE